MLRGYIAGFIGIIALALLLAITISRSGFALIIIFLLVIIGVVILLAYKK